jgi:hypothetical protein
VRRHGLEGTEKRGRFCAVLPATIDGGAAAARPTRRWTDNDERGSRRTAFRISAVRGTQQSVVHGPMRLAGHQHGVSCFVSQDRAGTNRPSRMRMASLNTIICSCSDREGEMNGHREGSRLRGYLWLERLDASNVIAKPRV